MAFNIAGRRYRPRVFTTILTLALIGVLFGLGAWQLDRMREKRALFADFAAGARSTVNLSAVSSGRGVRYQRVAAAGHFDSKHQILLDNLTHDGQAGYHVLTPFVTDAGSMVLVDRGWISQGVTRSDLPDVSVGTGMRTITGRLDELPRAGIALRNPASDDSWPRVLSYPDMAELQTLFDRRLYPQIVLLDPDQPDGHVREWRPATFPPERHLGYAITWFALAATVLIIHLVTSLQRTPGRA